MSTKWLSRRSRGSNLSSRQREMTQSRRMARASWGNTCGRRVRMQISQVCIPVRWPHRTPISSLARHICEQHKRRPESLRDSGSTCTSAVLTNCNVITANLFTCHRIAGNTRRTPRVLNEEILCVRRSSMAPLTCYVDLHRILLNVSRMIEIGVINAVQFVPLTWLKIYRLLFVSYNTICEL